MDNFEALFDVSNTSVIIPTETVEQEIRPVIKKRKLNREAVLKLADNILDGKVGCRYDSVIEENADLVPLYDPVLDLPYEPYDYQKISAVAIDAALMGGGTVPTNVLVSSPTGSGKTFLIKHAALRAVQNNQRLIIGVPLVALGEQTFSELRVLLKNYRRSNDPGYSPVGIRTGPSEKFPDADILVCTYEVIAIQMALSIEFLDNVNIVILDEIHFMANRERGSRVESIASNLPQGMMLIGLSGTIPNAKEFAHSMSRATQKKTRLVGLKNRPIRLRYFAHLGGKLCEICHNRPGTVSQRFKKKAWDYVMRTVEKRPKRLNTNQMRGRMLQLVRDLREQDKLPCMVVGFSCKMLNQLGDQLYSVDLLENKAQKSYIHQRFQEIKNQIEEKEWGLFAPLLEMTKRGIGVHHSQMCKPYLELLPDLVKRGMVRLVLATSTLSTGIDLPVRSIVVLQLIQPGKNGFRPVESSLLKQIFGRAGRPGQEKEGNAIIAMWQQPDPRVNITELLCAPSQPVRGVGMVQPREILSNKLFHRTAEDLLLSPFSSRDFSHVTPVVEDLKEVLEEEQDPAVEPWVERFQIVHRIRATTDKHWRYVDAMVNSAKKNDTVVVDPDDGTVPLRWTVVSTRPLRVREHKDKVPNGWVFDCIPCRAKRARIEDKQAFDEIVRPLLKTLEERTETNPNILQKARKQYGVQHRVKNLQKMVSVESHPLYGEYANLLDKLIAYGFLGKDRVVTTKGRMVIGILGTSDPLCLVESWTNNLLPRQSPAAFASALSCFLQNKRNRQPADLTGVYANLCDLQRHIAGDEEELGTNMMEPIRDWMEGKSILQICSQYEYASAGHVCKTIQRLCQLLEQLEEAAVRVGDTNLQELCDETGRKATRGLPFLPSLYLK